MDERLIGHGLKLVTLCRLTKWDFSTEINQSLFLLRVNNTLSRNADAPYCGHVSNHVTIWLARRCWVAFEWPHATTEREDSSGKTKADRRGEGLGRAQVGPGDWVSRGTLRTMKSGKFPKRVRHGTSYLCNAKLCAAVSQSGYNWNIIFQTKHQISNVYDKFCFIPSL